MKKIERPDWDKLVWYMEQHQKIASNLDTWFDDYIEPLNKALDEAVEVYGERHLGNRLHAPMYQFSYSKTQDSTHKAYLIGIEPIKQKKCDHTPFTCFVPDDGAYMMCSKCKKPVKPMGGWLTEEEVKAALEREGE